MLGEYLEILLDSKKIQPVNPKGNQPWIFTGRTGAEAEASILWLSDMKSWHIGKLPDAGKDWEQEEKRGNRGWDGWMASLTQWSWVLANSGKWWITEKPGVLQSMRLQRVRYNLVTKQQRWLSSCFSIIFFFFFGKVSFLHWIACAPLSKNQLGTFVWASSWGFDPWVEKILWRREWQPTSVYLPGEFHRQRSLAGYSPGGHKSQTGLSD